MGIPTFDLAEFQRRLGEALAWYRSKVPVLDPEHGLRTAALALPAGLKTPTEETWGEPSHLWTAETLKNYLDRKHQDRTLHQRLGYARVQFPIAEKHRAG
jgi:hypothetical protein